MKKSALLFVAALALCAVVAAQQPKMSAVAANQQWDKIKTLVGDWESYTTENPQKTSTKVSIRMTGGGSAIMHWMGAGTPYEMITMFHMDKSDLMATHYCAAHNQPRFVAKPSTKPNEVAFDFKDGTNIHPGDGYMRQLVITFVDSDHHDETWGFDNNGKIQSDVFHLTRVKK